MPELPEVECLTRAVRRVLKGGRVVDAEFLRADLRDPIPVEAFRNLVVGERIDDVFRRSKYMLLQTRKGFAVFHLGMTGNMILQDVGVPKVLHTHAIFSIERKSGEAAFLHFIDPRRFGRIACISGDKYEEHAFFADLGPEPLSTRNLAAHLYERSRRKKQPIKSFLMDGRVIVGVGNIYASEALFRAGIHPERSAGSVTIDEFEILSTSIKETLKASIASGGTSFRDFRNSDGNPGYFAVKLAVYDRESKACFTCGQNIRQVRQCGRSTFFCPICQS